MVELPGGDSVITPDGRLIMVRDVLPVEDGHPVIYEMEGSNTRDYIRDGFIRIGGDFSGGKSDYLFFEGSIEALRRHSRLIQDIAGEWAQEGAIIELSNGKQSIEVSMDDIFYTENVGDLFQRRINFIASPVGRTEIGITHPRFKTHLRFLVNLSPVGRMRPGIMLRFLVNGTYINQLPASTQTDHSSSVHKRDFRVALFPENVSDV